MDPVGWPVLSFEHCWKSAAKLKVCVNTDSFLACKSETPSNWTDNFFIVREIEGFFRGFVSPLNAMMVAYCRALLGCLARRLGGGRASICADVEKQTYILRSLSCNTHTHLQRA